MDQPELKTERVPIMCSPELVKRIDDYRFANRIGSRSKAIRILVENALATDDVAKDYHK